MSELTSEQAPGQTPQAPSEPQPQAAPAEPVASGRTPDKPREAERPFNLFDSQEFRNFQRSVVAPMEQELKALRQQVREAQTANMDPEERLQYDYREMQQQLQYEREQRERLQYEYQREQDLQRFSREYGVPREQLEDATSPYEAQMKAMEWKHKREIEELRKSMNQASQEEPGRRYEPPAVDVGGGRAPSTMQEWEKARQDALKRGDSDAYYRLILSRPE